MFDVVVPVLQASRFPVSSLFTGPSTPSASSSLSVARAASSSNAQQFGYTANHSRYAKQQVKMSNMVAVYARHVVVKFQLHRMRQYGKSGTDLIGVRIEVLSKFGHFS